MATNKIKCPECGIEIALQPKEGMPERLVAFHNCGGQMRQVYEADAPAWPPPRLRDRLDQIEPIKPRRNK